MLIIDIRNSCACLEENHGFLCLAPVRSCPAFEERGGIDCTVAELKRVLWSGEETRKQILGSGFDSKTICSFFSQLELCNGKIENTQQEKCA